MRVAAGAGAGLDGILHRLDLVLAQLADRLADGRIALCRLCGADRDLGHGRAGTNKVDNVEQVVGQAVLLGANVVLARGVTAVDVVSRLQSLLSNTSSGINGDPGLGGVDMNVFFRNAVANQPLFDGVDALVIGSEHLDDIFFRKVAAIVGRGGVRAAVGDLLVERRRRSGGQDLHIVEFVLSLLETALFQSNLERNPGVGIHS